MLGCFLSLIVGFSGWVECKLWLGQFLSKKCAKWNLPDLLIHGMNLGIVLLPLCPTVASKLREAELTGWALQQNTQNLKHSCNVQYTFHSEDCNHA